MPAIFFEGRFPFYSSKIRQDLVESFVRCITDAPSVLIGLS